MKPVAKKKSSLRKRLRHLAQEGMTLVEIMVVVIIMALIATAVGVAVLPKIREARIKTARTDESTVKAAAEMWIAEHSGQCPSVQQLVDDGELDRSRKTQDPWDHDYTIECQADSVTISSGGPDGTMGTEDDVRM